MHHEGLRCSREHTAAQQLRENPAFSTVASTGLGSGGGDAGAGNGGVHWHATKASTLPPPSWLSGPAPAFVSHQGLETETEQENKHKRGPATAAAAAEAAAASAANEVIGQCHCLARMYTPPHPMRQQKGVHDAPWSPDAANCNFLGGYTKGRSSVMNGNLLTSP